MGLFTQRPEHNEEWAGLPGEPLHPESEAERLAEAAPLYDAVSLDGVGGSFGSVESIVIPAAPVVDVARPAQTDGDGEGDEPDDTHR